MCLVNSVPSPKNDITTVSHEKLANAYSETIIKSNSNSPREVMRPLIPTILITRAPHSQVGRNNTRGSESIMASTSPAIVNMNSIYGRVI